MKTALAALLALALGAAGPPPSPAFAGDGETGTPSKDAEKPACGGQVKECGDAAKCSDGDEACGKAGSECAGCVEGAKEAKACCVAKKAAADLQVVTLAVLNAEGEGWKAVAAAVPEAEAKRLEKERLDAFAGLVKVRRAIETAKAECKAVVDEAKAEGGEASCDVTSAYEADVKALEKKARAILDGLSATVKEVVGADKVAGLAEGVRKDGDPAKAVMEKVRAEAAKPVEREQEKKAEEAGADPAAPAPKNCGS